MASISASDAADLVDDCLLEEGLARQSIDSFDHFVDGGKLFEMFRAHRANLSVRRAATGAVAKRQCSNPAASSAAQLRGDDIVGCDIEVGDLLVGAPCVIESDGTRLGVLPTSVRARNLSYVSELYTTVVRTIRTRDGGKKIAHLTQRIGWLPVVVGSKRCHLRDMCDDAKRGHGECVMDPGGYCILNGSERVIIPQERRASNTIFVLPAKAVVRHSLVADISSQTDEIGKAATSLQLQLRAPSGGLPEIIAHMTYCRVAFNVFIVMRAFGIESDDELLALVAGNEDDREFFGPAISDARARAPTAASARALISAASAPQTSEWAAGGQSAFAANWTVDTFMAAEILPHIGIGPEFGARKACFLGLMVRRITGVHFGRRRCDDRDHYRNKRVDSVGPLMAQLMRQLFRQFFRSTRGYMQKMVDRGLEPDITSTFREDAISRGIAQCINTGNWHVGKLSVSATPKTGVAQPLNRINFSSTLSHLRRTNTPMLRDGKVTTPRLVHNSHLGRICPSESPEGKQCGLVHNLALLARITHGVEAGVVAAVRSIIEKVVPGIVPAGGGGGCMIFVDGAWIGTHVDPIRVVATLRNLRRSSRIPAEVSVAHDVCANELRVNLDAGRIVRPLFVVDPETHSLVLTLPMLSSLGPRPRWGRALSRLVGAIDFVDADEEDTLLVAMGVRDLAHRGKKMNFTHCEVDPAAILGVIAAGTPASPFNQSPRNAYHDAMEKQALAGDPTTNSSNRMDTNTHRLVYCQKPLVTTRLARSSGRDAIPTGFNAIFAIMECHENIEDSMIMNQGAIDRGLGRSLFYHTFSDTEGGHGTAQKETFERLRRSTMRGPTTGTDEIVDDDGIVPTNVFVREDDNIICKTLTVGRDDTESRTQPVRTKIDKSVLARGMDEGIVHAATLSVGTDPEASRTVKAQVRSVRIPEVGDKWASRHGQKGTCGAIWQEEDMPFTENGIVPDFIMNPHAFPSRMTVGNMLESVVGKEAAATARFADLTPFADWDPSASTAGDMWATIDRAMDGVEDCGFPRDGTETLYAGRTGERLKGRVTIGVVYFQRLKHMVVDKFNARDRGPTQILTRQPVEGRAKNGGQRFGEMERDCLIGHGTSAVIRDRTFLSSDYSSVCVCRKCGLPAIDTKCTACGTDDVGTVQLPHASNLLFKEFMSMCVAPRIGIAEDTTPRPAVGVMADGNTPSLVRGCVDYEQVVNHIPDSLFEEIGLNRMDLS